MRHKHLQKFLISGTLICIILVIFSTQSTAPTTAEKNIVDGTYVNQDESDLTLMMSSTPLMNDALSRISGPVIVSIVLVFCLVGSFTIVAYSAFTTSPPRIQEHPSQVRTSQPNLHFPEPLQQQQRPRDKKKTSRPEQDSSSQLFVQPPQPPQPPQPSQVRTSRPEQDSSSQQEQQITTIKSDLESSKQQTESQSRLNNTSTSDLELNAEQQSDIPSNPSSRKSGESGKSGKYTNLRYDIWTESFDRAQSKIVWDDRKSACVHKVDSACDELYRKQKTNDKLAEFDARIEYEEKCVDPKCSDEGHIYRLEVINKSSKDNERIKVISRKKMDDEQNRRIYGKRFLIHKEKKFNFDQLYEIIQLCINNYENTDDANLKTAIREHLDGYLNYLEHKIQKLNDPTEVSHANLLKEIIKKFLSEM